MYEAMILPTATRIKSINLEQNFPVGGVIKDIAIGVLGLGFEFRPV